MRKSAIAMLALFTTTSSFGGDASGKFKADGQPPIQPKFAAAYEVRDPRDAHKRAIEVILSEKAIDAAAAVEDLEPHTQVINQDVLDDTNYILLWVRPDGDVSMNATYSATMTQFVDASSLGHMVAELTKNTPDEIAGRVGTARKDYSGDLKFSTKVTRRAPGTKLANNGGPAGKAFLALIAAVDKKDWDGIRKHITPSTQERFDGLDDAIQTLGFWIPKKKVKVVAGEQRGDEVVLDVEGEIFEGQQALYLIRMVKSGSEWQFDRATKAGLID